MSKSPVLDKDTGLLAALGIAGALIGLAKLFSGNDKITVRLATTRAILSGALGMCAAASTIFVPNLSMPAQVGLACVLASLGVSALEKLFERWVNK